jgi:hypothetical protein
MYTCAKGGIGQNGQQARERNYLSEPTATILIEIFLLLLLRYDRATNFRTQLAPTSSVLLPICLIALTPDFVTNHLTPVLVGFPSDGAKYAHAGLRTEFVHQVVISPRIFLSRLYSTPSARKMSARCEL